MTDGSLILIGLLVLVAVALAFWVGRLSAPRSRAAPIPEFSPDDGPLAAPREDAPPVRRAPPPAASAGANGNGATAAPRTAAPRGKPPPAAAG